MPDNRPSVFFSNFVPSQGVFQADLEVGIPILGTLIWASPNDGLPKILKYPTECKFFKLSGLEQSELSAIFQALEWHPGLIHDSKLRGAFEKSARINLPGR